MPKFAYVAAGPNGTTHSGVEEAATLAATRMQLVSRDLAPPDLVIYLQAKPETLIERVQRRGAAYEKDIPEPYLIGLAET